MTAARDGIYETLITEQLRHVIEGLPAERVLRSALDAGREPEELARHLYFVIRRALAVVAETSEIDQSRARLDISNRVLSAVQNYVPDALSSADYLDISEQPWLIGITSPSMMEDGIAALPRPTVPFNASALLVNGRAQPRIGHELKAELATADDVALLCSFIMTSGLRIVRSALAGVIERGGRVRVITTTYMGATQRKAVDELCSLGAEVKISFESSTSRLHAKAWLLERATGATTAYVGSSNLSSAAMLDGLEWNVRISNREQPHLIDTIRATFDNYWNDSEFENYDPQQDGERLADALSRAGSSESGSIAVNFANIEVSPRPFQQEVLDRLEAERSLFGRTRNLVVMATGTGKTVVAALDFRRLAAQGRPPSLLFVAHRKEILAQSLATFRTVLRDGSFGEFLVDGNRPTEWRHVFSSIQSMSDLESLPLERDSFDVVVIDEIHHAAASTYRRLLDYFNPKYLLGLTATPERADGESILEWFGGRISVELRLWEAIDRQIPAPFHYFGLHDNVDLQAAGVPWRRGTGYDIAALDKVYTGNDARVALILHELAEHVDDLERLCGIGFCVSMDHAEFMAKKFRDAGIPAEAVTSRLSSEERDLALANLRNGLTKIVFAVDIFNEGVDVPQVNTLLMLRPTESATIFLQQLGRGLRRANGKNVLTVLDFVGNQHKNFRFDQKYGALLGLTRRQLSSAIDEDFPTLPSGCHFELDRVSKEQVLGRLRTAVRNSRTSLAADLRLLGDVPLAVFLDQVGIEPEDLYRNGLCLTFLKDSVREYHGTRSDLEVRVAKALGRLLHMDDERRLELWRRALSGVTAGMSDADVLMVGYVLFGPSATVESTTDNLRSLSQSNLSDEIRSLVEILECRRTRMVYVSDAPQELAVHARYSRDEILAAFLVPNPSSVRQGVTWAEKYSADLAFVTLNKSDKHFSPTTMYADTAISEWIFQWESQSTTSADGKVGQRYVHHRERGSTFHLFVRDFKNDPETGVTMPYMYLGAADYMSHTGNRPMRILWKLRRPMPADVLVRSRVIAS